MVVTPRSPKSQHFREVDQMKLIRRSQRPNSLLSIGLQSSAHRKSLQTEINRSTALLYVDDLVTVSLGTLGSMMIYLYRNHGEGNENLSMSIGSRRGIQY